MESKTLYKQKMSEIQEGQTSEKNKKSEDLRGVHETLLPAVCILNRWLIDFRANEFVGNGNNVAYCFHRISYSSFEPNHHRNQTFQFFIGKTETFPMCYVAIEWVYLEIADVE